MGEKVSLWGCLQLPSIVKEKHFFFFCLLLPSTPKGWVLACKTFLPWLFQCYTVSHLQSLFFLSCLHIATSQLINTPVWWIVSLLFAKKACFPCLKITSKCLHFMRKVDHPPEICVAPWQHLLTCGNKYVIEEAAWWGTAKERDGRSSGPWRHHGALSQS